MTHAIHRLHLARVNLKGTYHPPTYADTRIDVFAYVVTCGLEVVLVDTGVGLGNAYVDRVFEPSRRSIVDQLAQFNIAPSDVTKVVNSHLHFDHCGNNALFAHADVLVQGDELEAARTKSYTIREWFDYPGAKLCPVAGDYQIGNGISLIATPGHTPGHQSVLIETEQEKVLIAAQAAFTADEYHRDGDPAEQAHQGLQAQYVESIARLKSLGAQRVYFSHDA